MDLDLAQSSRQALHFSVSRGDFRSGSQAAVRGRIEFAGSTAAPKRKATTTAIARSAKTSAGIGNSLKAATVVKAARTCRSLRCREAWASQFCHFSLHKAWRICLGVARFGGVTSDICCKLSQYEGAYGERMALMLPGISISTKPDDYTRFKLLRFAIFDGTT